YVGERPGRDSFSMNFFQRKDAKTQRNWRFLSPWRLCAPCVFALTLTSNAQTNTINLETVLRLARAQNLDVQIARSRLAEAKAVHESARAQFFPWLSPGIVYRRHDGLIQDTTGKIFDVHKQSYAPGATLGAQLDIGDALFKSLSTKQQADAAAHFTEAQRQA